MYLSPDMHNGPALKLTIVQQGDHNISVDITPSLISDLPVTTHGWVPSTLVQPMTSLLRYMDFSKEETDTEILRAGTHFVPKEDEAFKLSYSKAETALYRRLDGPNECRKMCHKVVKKLVQKFISQSPNGAPGISSYIFKVSYVLSLSNSLSKVCQIYFHIFKHAHDRVSFEWCVIGRPATIIYNYMVS